MNILFRVDSSEKIGTGHVYRCLALAGELADYHGADISFLISDNSNNLKSEIEQWGYNLFTVAYSDPFNATSDAYATKKVIKMIGKVDWLVVDRYGCEGAWEAFVKSFVKRILSIDDLAEKTRVCSLLLNNNYLPGIEGRYGKMAPGGGKLLGLKYSPLDRRFYMERSLMRKENFGIRRLLISFGGADIYGATLKAVEALLSVTDGNVEIVVVAGRLNSDFEKLKRLAIENKNIELYETVGNMAELLSSVDLAIGALGVSTWERMCLGVPSAIATISPVQAGPAKALHKDGLAYHLGAITDLTTESMATSIKKIIGNEKALNEMSVKGQKLVDGLGAKRVAEAMASY